MMIKSKISNDQRTVFSPIPVFSLILGVSPVGCSGDSDSAPVPAPGITSAPPTLAGGSSGGPSSVPEEPSGGAPPVAVGGMAGTGGEPGTSSGGNQPVGAPGNEGGGGSSTGGAPSQGGGSGGQPPAIPMDACGFEVGLQTGPAIAVDNLEPGVTVPHQMVSLVGRTSIPVQTLTVVHGDLVLEIPTSGVDFKSLSILEPGLNHVGLMAEGHTPLCFPVSFSEPENDHQVRYFSFTAVDSNEDRFVYINEDNRPHGYGCLNGESCDARTIADRMRFTALLNQMLVAETLVNSGGPRETFTLSRDANGEILDPLFISTKTVDEMMQIVEDAGRGQGSFTMMTNVAMPEIAEAERVEGVDPALIKHVMIFRDIQAGAWGGGNRASLGAGTFNTWAVDLPQFYERLHDLRDPLEHGAVSTNGDTISRSYTLNVGALIHEIGHTFGLPHPTGQQPCPAIMGGGFRTLHTFLLPAEIPVSCFTPESGVENKPNYLEEVVNSPWIKGAGEPDEEPTSSSSSTSPEADPADALRFGEELNDGQSACDAHLLQ